MKSIYVIKEIFCSNFSIVSFTINICINRMQLLSLVPISPGSLLMKIINITMNIFAQLVNINISRHHISIFRRTLFVSCEQRIAIPSRSFAYRSMSAKYQVKRVNFPSHVNAKVCARHDLRRFISDRYTIQSVLVRFREPSSIPEWRSF